ncbi:MAG: AraC family transcriptional regulator [Butyrivibrio sp.]|nr:AraC family transcriptional regulator [Butyrivibrio sp.]
MGKPKFFYEDRDKYYDCHIWLHPNYPKHLHKHLEFAYVNEGEMPTLVGSQEKKMRKGDCALAFPNQMHSYSSTKDVDLMLIIVDMDYIGEFHDELSNYILENPFFTKSELSEYGQSALDLLYKSSHTKDHPYELEKGMLMVLLSDIFSNLSMIKRDGKTELNTIEKILLYINENLSNHINATSISKELGLSTSYISHLFAKELNMTLPTYLTRQRLSHACDMLKTTTKSVTDIAYETGFSSLRTFLRSFQTYYNMTPTAFRTEAFK